jgi:hypothetical protein
MKEDVTTRERVGMPVFSLGNIPLVNNLNKSFEESIDCDKYLLSLVHFEKSEMVRLSHIVDPHLLFDTYLYYSGVSEPYIKHCGEMYNYLSEKVGFNPGDLVVDIGGNDGTLLNVFKKNNSEIALLNIEPSNIAEVSMAEGIETVKEYFGQSTSAQFSKTPKFFITTNVYQHLYDIKDFAEVVRDSMGSDSIWCLEFPYLIQTMKTLQFDQIYHEHIYYYHLTALHKFFTSIGLQVINVSEYPIHAGTMRLLISREDSVYTPDNTIKDYLEQEKDYGLKEFIEWGQAVEKHTDECKKELLKIMKDKKVFGFGAAAKGCTFLNYLGLNYRHIPYIIDDTPRKQGLYVPGTGIPIVERSVIKEKNPDYILILAHNFKDHIIASLREYGYQNKFIVCFPKFEII